MCARWAVVGKAETLRYLSQVVRVFDGVKPPPPPWCNGKGTFLLWPSSPETKPNSGLPVMPPTEKMSRPRGATTNCNTVPGVGSVMPRCEYSIFIFISCHTTPKILGSSTQSVSFHMLPRELADRVVKGPTAVLRLSAPPMANGVMTTPV
jgi:hypothetical protein